MVLSSGREGGRGGGGHPEQATGWSKQYYCTGMRLVNLHHTTMQPMMDTHFLAHHKPAEEETTIQVSQCVTIYKNVDSSKLKRNLKIHIVFLPLGFLTNTTQHNTADFHQPCYLTTDR